MESNQEGTFERKFASEGNSETRGVESIGNCCNNFFGMHDTIILLPSNDYDGKQVKVCKLRFVTDIVK